MSSERADRDVGQETSARRDGDAAEDDATVVLPPLRWGPDEAAAGDVPPHTEDYPTIVIPALAWVAEQVVAGAIPQQPAGFLPRPTLLARLEEADPEASPVTVLTGPPGAGKTQLAAAHARAKLTAGWPLVAWVDAADATTLLAGLAAVADAVALKDDDPGQDAADLRQVVRQRLETDGERCLLVLDGVGDLDLVRPLVPDNGASRVLITTRQSVADLGTSVPVDAFTEEEALAFLAERSGLDEAEATAVAAELGQLPLALALAAAVLAGGRIGYDTYLARLRTLSAEEYLRQERHPYPGGAAKSVLLSLAAVRADDPKGVSIRVLEIMAVLSAAGVRRDLLHAAGQAGLLAKSKPRSWVSAALADRALARLAQRSLLTFSFDGRTVIAHDLVMRVVREQLARQGRLAATCRAAASVLDTRAGKLADSQGRAAVRDLTEQISALRQHSAGLAADVGDELAGPLLSLQLWAFDRLHELGDSVSQATAASGLLAAGFEEEAGPEHPKILDPRDNGAAARSAESRAAERIALLEDTLATQERLLGPDHPDALTTHNSLAAAYWDAGRTTEAIRGFERTLAARERLLGADHPRTLNSRDNLGEAYRRAGRAAEAIPLFERTLAGRERLLGLHHSATLTSRCHLAKAYEDTGRVADAIPLLEQILAAYERLLGPGHPSTLATRDGLALASQEAGRAAPPGQPEAFTNG